MSSKTLERRLSERKASYREIVDGIRCDLAKHYLADTELRLHQIAYALGYSEPGALVRAFKRWTNSRPCNTAKNTVEALGSVRAA